jgi:beta-lactamase regulating signal transducer with metallopeptidase domain
LHPVGDAVDFLAAHGGVLLAGGTALLAGGAAAARLQRSPVHRQRLCELAIASTVLWLALASVPMRRWLRPERPTVRPNAAAVVVPELPTLPLVPPPDPAPAPREVISVAPRPAAPAFDAAVLRRPPAVSRSPQPDPRPQRLLAGAYLAGAAAGAAWLLLGGLLLARVVRKARPAPAELEALLASLCERGRRPRLLVSATCRRPFSCGVIRPTIVVPESLTDAADGGPLRQVLLHELAHVGQCDAWGNALFNLALPLLWVHPLYWLLRHDAHLARELVADDWAAGHAGKERYVADLVAVARDARRGRVAFAGPLGSVALFRSPTNFYRRMHMLMQRRETLATSCSRRWRLTMLAVFTAAVALATGVAGRAPARAQEAPSTNAEARRQKVQSEVDTLKARLADTQVALNDALDRLQAVQRQREVDVKLRADRADAERQRRSEAEARAVDGYLTQKLREQPATRPNGDSDEEFARRMHFDIVGTPPSADSINRFKSDSDPEKRQRLAMDLIRQRLARAPATDTPAANNLAPAKDVPATGRGDAHVSAGQIDLVTLALSYIDAIGDAETAKARLERMAGLPANQRTDLELQEYKVVAQTAERKLRLLKGVVEIALTGARSEYKQVKELADQGVAPRSQASEAEAKLQILELILKSGQ